MVVTAAWQVPTDGACMTDCKCSSSCGKGSSLLVTPVVGCSEFGLPGCFLGKG